MNYCVCLYCKYNLDEPFYRRFFDDEIDAYRFYYMIEDFAPNEGIYVILFSKFGKLLEYC